MRNPSQALDTIDAPQQGILFVLVGVLMFSLQDVIVKAISANYAVHQIVFVRSVVALVPLLLFLRLEGGLARLHTRRPVLHLARGSAMFMSYICFYLGLVVLPLADTVALFFIAPLFVTALSVPLLGEKVGARRWAAVAVGFLGVLVMLRPRAGAVEPASVLPILGALFYALAAVITRRLGETDSGSSMAFYAMSFYVVASAAVGATMGTRGGAVAGTSPALGFMLRPWIIPPWPDLGLMALCGLVAGLGFYLVTQAYRLAEVARVATFEYIAVPLSVLWGYLFWREMPGPFSILGMVLVVGGGLYVLRRESSRQRAVVD